MCVIERRDREGERGGGRGKERERGWGREKERIGDKLPQTTAKA